MPNESFPAIPDDLPEQQRLLAEEWVRRQRAFDDLWPEAHRLRRRYFVERTDEARFAMEAAIAVADAAQAEVHRALEALIEASDFDREDFEDPEPQPLGDPLALIGRVSVIAGAPTASGFVEDYVPRALDLIESHAPSGWLAEEPRSIFQLPSTDDGEPVSIVKGVRLESERPRGNRLRQAVGLARDYLDGNSCYDHFGGAIAVTQLAQLGRMFEALQEVQGHADRIRALFSGADADATMLELLVAAACAARGRKMSFVEATSVRSPDLRCNDAFEMVVECKRSVALSDYEVGEEARMRDLFRHIAAGARDRGLCGLFEVELTVEVGLVDISEVAAKCLLQRLAPHPARPLAYPWGSVAFRPSRSRVDLEGATKAYSPTMLEQVFGWDMALPEWDGLVCKVDAAPAEVIDVARSPVGLSWRVVAEAAVTKRSRAPLGLFNKALSQVPPGDFGLVYLAYMEGARADIADNRTKALLERLQGWEHDGAIRVPAAFLVRQYPVPVGHGDPDMVESTVKLLSEESGGDEWMFREYPATVYTSGG